MREKWMRENETRAKISTLKVAADSTPSDPPAAESPQMKVARPTLSDCCPYICWTLRI